MGDNGATNGPSADTGTVRETDPARPEIFARITGDGLGGYHVTVWEGSHSRLLRYYLCTRSLRRARRKADKWVREARRRRATTVDEERK